MIEMQRKTKDELLVFSGVAKATKPEPLKDKCLICGGKVKDRWNIEGVIDIRSYYNVAGEKLYNVVFNIDGWEDGIIGNSLINILKQIAHRLRITKKRRKNGD